LLAVPLLCVCALQRAGLLGGCCARGGAPSAAAGTLCAAFSDGALRPSAQWWLCFEQALTAFCAVVVALSTRGRDDDNLFLSLQWLVINVVLLCVSGVLYVAPHAQPWRTRITAALYGVTAVAALVSLLFRFAGAAVQTGAPQLALAVVPLVLALALFSTLLRQWWVSLFKRREDEPLTETPAKEAAPAAAVAGAATPAAAGGEPRGESAPTPTPAAGGQGPDADTTRIPPLSKTATQRNVTFTVNPLLLLAQRDGRRRQFAAPAAPAAPVLPATPALATSVVKEELGVGDARARAVEKQPGDGGGGGERRLVFTMNPLRKRSTGGIGSRGAECFG
jgi:hypothetical protein